MKSNAPLQLFAGRGDALQCAGIVRHSRRETGRTPPPGRPSGAARSRIAQARISRSRVRDRGTRRVAPSCGTRVSCLPCRLKPPRMAPGWAHLGHTSRDTGGAETRKARTGPRRPAGPLRVAFLRYLCAVARVRGRLSRLRAAQRAALRDGGALCAPLRSLACRVSAENVRKASFDGHPLHFPLQRGTRRNGRPAQPDEKMARPERLELPTYWFVASRSIQLSYGRAISSVARRAWFVNR